MANRLARDGFPRGAGGARGPGAARGAYRYARDRRGISDTVLLELVRLAGFVRRYERTVARERILREAGAMLVGALNREDIHVAALKAAMELM